MRSLWGGVESSDGGRAPKKNKRRFIEKASETILKNSYFGKRSKEGDGGGFRGRCFVKMVIWRRRPFAGGVFLRTENGGKGKEKNKSGISADLAKTVKIAKGGVEK